MYCVIPLHHKLKPKSQWVRSGQFKGKFVCIDCNLYFVLIVVYHCLFFHMWILVSQVIKKEEIVKKELW